MSKTAILMVMVFGAAVCSASARSVLQTTTPAASE
jgi:hypothetical protein